LEEPAVGRRKAVDISRLRRRLTLAGATALATGVLLAVPATARTVSVSVGGDSSWRVTASATTSADTVSVGKKLTGTSKIKFSAYVLGLPIPVTGYYANSFPTTFRRPVLKSADADLSSRTYSKVINAYLGTTQWEVRGKSSFWGSKSVKIVGDARAASKATRYFYAGTRHCGSGCTNANAIVRVRTR
jgi:hypothetical protein